MNRLSAYLVRLFTRETLGLLGVMLGLLFLVQSLKIFDVIVVQNQNFFTLVGQALLAMPPLAIALANVCMGIGMVRALGALQASHELHIMHASRQLRAMLAGIAIFAIGGALVILVLANMLEPWSNHRLSQWAASVAADIVGRTLTPHRVSQVVPGITIVIGGREGAGNITDFFADDRRDPEMRRTYTAKTAKVGTDKDGYVLLLKDGSLQYLSADHDFSQISFKSYSVALNKLTEQVDNRDDLAESTSVDLVAKAASSGWTDEILRRLLQRMAEGLRAIAMVVFMAALAIFPHARRGRTWVPMELVAIIVAYADKTVTSNLGGTSHLGYFSGPLVVLTAGLAVFAVRMRLLRLPVLVRLPTRTA